MSVERWAARIAELPRPLLLAFDVDGTLAPIAPSPDGARVPPATAAELRRLAAGREVHVALVTGRHASSLRRVVRVPGAWRALEHGRVVVAPGERVPRAKLGSGVRAALGAFERWADEALPQGATLERKATSRALHARALAERDAPLAERLLQQARQRASALGLHARSGRQVVEVEPEPYDKGRALGELKDRTVSRGVVYAGDDLTDYPAIRLAGQWGGIGLFVRSAERPEPPDFASGTLAGPHEVAALLASVALASVALASVAPDDAR